MSNQPSRASTWFQSPPYIMQFNRSIAYILIILISAITSFGQSIEGKGEGTVRVIGNIHTDGGQLPGAGVIVRIETDGGRLTAIAPATASGSFSFESVAKKVSQLTVTAEGYETAEQYLDLTRTANIVQVTVNLIPKRKTAAPEAPPALSDAKASKKALKEFEKGDSALTARKLDEAHAHLKKAVTDSPCYARAQTELATVLAELHKMAEAEAAARKARDCDPDFIEAYIQLGMILNTENKFTEGEAALQEGVRRAPAQWQFYYQLAAAHYGLKDFTRAEQDYQRVLSLNPSPPSEFRVRLADVYLKENAYDKAYAQMQDYLKSEPDGRFAQKVKNIMHQMEASGVLKKGTS